ncbi:MAG: hypothetical protein KC731_40330, partial [Myxococcales bacterium]|nr:hypothetical protein [Myxococcales bacterium]
RGRALFPALGRVSKCADDLALVVLDGPVGEFRRPLRREGGIEPLEPITVIGFGAPGSGDNYVAVRRHVATIVEDVGTSDEPNQEGVSVGTFETPPVLCDGDAGAPAMAASGAVIGIGASPIGPSVDFTCEEAFHNRFIRLDSHWDLVEQAFAEAGEPLWLESDPGPPWSLEGGQSCDGDSVCASELCLDDGRCAQLCRADRDCSGGELCSLDAGYCVSPDELPFSQTCSLVAGASRRSDAPIWAILALLALGTRRRQAR